MKDRKILFLTVLLLFFCPGFSRAENDASVLVPAIRYSADIGRDPFMPCLPIKEPVKSNAEVSVPVVNVVLPPMTIQGVIWEGSVKQAIIDNDVWTIGQTIKGAEIVDITKEGVEFLYSGKEFELPSPAVVFQKEIMKKGGVDDQYEK